MNLCCTLARINQQTEICNIRGLHYAESNLKIKELGAPPEGFEDDVFPGDKRFPSDETINLRKNIKMRSILSLGKKWKSK